MKRLICLLLLFSLLLAGCASIGERIKEPVNFYYIRKDYQEEMGTVIAAEVREASGHRYDLPYLLALYSMGPSDKNLAAPFPKSTTILPVEHSEAGLVLSLLNEIPTMTDAEYTLASACLAMTCMEMLNVEQVTVMYGERTVTINAENLLLTANSIKKLPEVTK